MTRLPFGPRILLARHGMQSAPSAVTTLPFGSIRLPRLRASVRIRGILSGLIRIGSALGGKTGCRDIGFISLRLWLLSFLVGGHDGVPRSGSQPTCWGSLGSEPRRQRGHAAGRVDADTGSAQGYTSSSVDELGSTDSNRIIPPLTMTATSGRLPSKSRMRSFSTPAKAKASSAMLNASGHQIRRKPGMRRGRRAMLVMASDLSSACRRTISSNFAIVSSGLATVVAFNVGAAA